MMSQTLYNTTFKTEARLYLQKVVLAFVSSPVRVIGPIFAFHSETYKNVPKKPHETVFKSLMTRNKGM